MKRKLNILIICKTLPWQFKGGIQTHTWQLAQELESKGHEVSILTSGTFRKPTSSYRKENINIIQIPYFPGRRLHVFNIAAEEMAFNLAVKEWVKGNHKLFDIIHTQGRSGYFLYAIQEVHHKLINTVHGLIDIESKESSRFNLNQSFHKKMAKYYENKLLKKVKRIITVSSSLQRDLLNKRSKQFESTVIPNGVITHITLKNTEVKSSKYLFIGRLHPIKGIDGLVSAMKNARTDIKLDVVGGGPLRKELLDIIEEYGLEEKVNLLGEKSSQEIDALIPQYQAIVLPSHYETQGIVLLEANSMGIPVIASGIEAIKEFVQHGYNGLLCNPAKPQSFIEAMEYLADNPIKAKHMGIMGQKLVQEKYDWKIIGKSIENIYYQIAN